MIVTSALSPAKPSTSAPEKTESVPDPGGSTWAGSQKTKAKVNVGPETAKRVAVVYRCMNGISDDIAAMPLQQFERLKIGELNLTQKIDPDPVTRNMSYLLEVQPNRWMTPFMLKKTAALWLLSWGNALIWLPPPPALRELFILPANMTTPKLDTKGYLWFDVRFPNGQKKLIPSVEVHHVMINSTNGIWGRGVIEYARETIGLRLGQSETAAGIQGKGVNPSAALFVNANLDKPGREAYRNSYSEIMEGPDNAGSLVVFDNKVVKFEPITMKLTDAQYLETTQYTDVEIANFFKYPAFKLNMGKQSYESNEQQDLDYLKSCIDPLLVPSEQEARVKWIAEDKQQTQYFKYIRESVLRTNAKSRAELHEIKIRSGTMQPNESREIEDQNGYAEGNRFYMTSNYQPIQPGNVAPAQEESNNDQTQA